MRTLHRWAETIGLAVLLLFPAAPSVHAQKQLILDTDFRTDVDDVGTLAMVHGLADLDRVNTIGIIATTAGSSVVGAIDAIDTFYSRPNIPIAVIRSSLATSGGDEYAPVLADTSRFPSDQTTATAPNSLAVYRSLLASAPDGSITIAVVGGQNGIYELMQSGANAEGDGIPLTGLQLIAQKVSELVIMGGHFTSATYSESNIRRGITAAQQVAANWPTPIVYSGWEIGAGVGTGAELINPTVNPVAKAYEVFSGDTGGAGGIGNRDSWDQTAALYAIVGLTYGGQTLWTLSEPHSISFDSGGRTLKTPSPTSNRYFLVQQMSDSGIADIISDLMTGYSGPPPPPPPPIGKTIAHYHFNELPGSADPGSPFVNSGSGGEALDLTNTGGPDGRDNTGSGGYGAASLPRHGTAFDVLASGNGVYHTTTHAAGGGALTDAAVLQSALQGSDGAFTYEALIKLNGITAEQNVLSHDGDGSSRGFLFRVVNGRLSLYTGATEVLADIPVAGPHAFQAGQWFHVAVAYTGAAGVTGNLTFYWTALSAASASANAIGTATLAADLAGSVNNRLGVGCTTRTPFRYETAGLIDEVRLSSIARGPQDFAFLWGSPDADEDGLPDYWETERGLDPYSANPAADHDADGLGDLLEYALGGSLTAPDPTRAPQVTIEGGYLTLSVARNPEATNVLFTVEVTGDVALWESTSTDVTVLINTPTQLKVRDNTPASSAPQRHLRLRVTPRE